MKLNCFGSKILGIVFGATVVLTNTEAKAFQIYTLSSGAPGGGNPTRFGVVDANTGVYTNISNLGVAAHRNLVSFGDSFYTTRRAGLNGELGLISRSGVFTLVGGANGLQRTVFGMSMDPGGTMYGVDFNANPNTLGTISTTSGAWSLIGSTGLTQVNNNTNSQGGKLAFHNGTLYMSSRATAAPITSRFGSVNTTTGAFASIGANPLMQYMVLTSYEGVLYGLYSNGSTATPAILPGIYTIDVATGASTRIRDIVGFGASSYLHGASAVPAPLPMLGAAAVFGSVRKLRVFSKRLATLKKIG
ncbi:MAG: hypothetical protein ACK59A_14840 [Cyanobacteriota bacterium]